MTSNKFKVGDLVRLPPDPFTPHDWCGIIVEIEDGELSVHPKNGEGKWAWFYPEEVELIQRGPWETMRKWKPNQ